MRIASVLLAGLALVSYWVPAGAQPVDAYPAKPVRVIVPVPLGGSMDVLARLIGAFMEARFKQPFIIDSRPGAATQIGTDALVKAPADGYTILVGSINPTSEEVLNKEWPFKFERDLTAISMFARGGYAIAVSNNVPINNMRELVAYSRANPGKLNQAEPAAISSDMAILKHRVQMGPMESIVYKGGAPSLQAIVSGEAHFYGAALLDAAPLAKEGKLKILAYSERERHPVIPNVPTVAESGVGAEDFEMTFWFCLYGRSGLPPAVVAKLSSAMLDLIKTPDFQNRLASYGLRTLALTPAESRDRAIARIRMLERAQAEGVKLR